MIVLDRAQVAAFLMQEADGIEGAFDTGFQVEAVVEANARAKLLRMAAQELDSKKSPKITREALERLAEMLPSFREALDRVPTIEGLTRLVAPYVDAYQARFPMSRGELTRSVTGMLLRAILSTPAFARAARLLMAFLLTTDGCVVSFPEPPRAIGDEELLLNQEFAVTGALTIERRGR